MCRWLAYSGSPIALDEVLFKPRHSLVMQSLKSRKGLEPTNGDGFGIGWYGKTAEPRLYRSTSPAWNDRNLRELAADVESGMFLAHVRAEEEGRRHGVENAMQKTLGISNGKRLWVFRYSSEGQSRSLFHSTNGENEFHPFKPLGSLA